MNLARAICTPIAMSITRALTGDVRVTGGGSPAFDPMSLFKPGDLGGFYNPNEIDTLFQTRTGPTVPVTGDGDPVQYIVDENGQFDLSRGVANDGFVFSGDLLVFDPAATNGRVSLSSASMTGFSQITVACGAYIDAAQGTPSNNNSLVELAFLNTATTAGAIVGLSLRTNGLLRASLFTTGGFAPSPPDFTPSTEPFCFGGVFDSASPTQTMFYDDTDFEITAAHSMPASFSFRAHPFRLIGQTVPFTGSGPIFFINRLLTATESANLKQWLRENTRKPAFDPASLFGVGDYGGAFDISRMDLCYQDLAGTVPVTALGQEVLSVRSYTNPAFLMKFIPSYSPTPCVYAEDAQGFPCLQEPSGTELVVYGVEDAGTAGDVLAYTSVQCALGQYILPANTLGGGSTIIGDTTGAMAPYTYSAVYSIDIGEGNVVAFGGLFIGDANLETPAYGENLDEVPFVFSTRVEDGAQDFGINLEPPSQGTEAQPPFPAPVGMRVWAGAGGNWYGGVLISRWLLNAELLNSQRWAAALAGKTLVAP